MNTILIFWTMTFYLLGLSATFVWLVQTVSKSYKKFTDIDTDLYLTVTAILFASLFFPVFWLFAVTLHLIKRGN